MDSVKVYLDVHACPHLKLIKYWRAYLQGSQQRDGCKNVDTLSTTRVIVDFLWPADDQC